LNFCVLCGFIAVFWRKTSTLEVRLWSTALFFSFLGSMSVLFVSAQSNPVLGLIGGLMQASFTGIMLLAFQSFFRRPLNWAYALSVPVFFTLTLLPSVRTGLDMKQVMLEIFALMTLGTLLICRDIVIQTRREQFPSAKMAIVLYGSFAVLNVVFIVLELLYPVSRIDGMIQSGWAGWAMLVTVMLKGMCALVIVVLASDRTEAQLRWLANTDMLTGAPNRRSFVANAEALLQNPGQNMMLAIVDLDHFKRINDTYGHLVGDRVLQMFSRHMAAQITPLMRFGRLGGEEFALFCPVIDKKKSLENLDALRKSVSNLVLIADGDDIRVDISIGVSFSHVCGNTLDAMMVAADTALYTAKREGRNRVCEFHPSQRLKQFAKDRNLEESGLRWMSM
jgi:diguanylate cyclase (GGDEF)-like protein